MLTANQQVQQNSTLVKLLQMSSQIHQLSNSTVMGIVTMDSIKIQQIIQKDMRTAYFATTSFINQFTLSRLLMAVRSNITMSQQSLLKILPTLNNEKGDSASWESTRQ